MSTSSLRYTESLLIKKMCPTGKVQLLGTTVNLQAIKFTIAIIPSKKRIKIKTTRTTQDKGIYRATFACDAAKNMKAGHLLTDLSLDANVQHQ